ncbi:solute carrier organic anion transporter family member 4A1-like [Sycon ciliatum]|uniref:solute carrier organic anion transporter family member 4A1-like n=1 Tax=Sycon ciliatum TaxID=27933 RepID=UPI0031F67A53
MDTVTNSDPEKPADATTSFVEGDSKPSAKDSDTSSQRSTSTTSETERSKEGRCGACWCNPNWLQFFNTPRWFLFFLCLYVLFQGLTVSGMNGVVIPTIEKRFRLPSQRSGLISGAYDISAAIFVLPVSYFGERAHKPRWLGIGCFLLGIGALVFTLPQFIGGKFVADHVLDFESCAADVNHTTYTSVCDEGVPGAYALLIIGQMIIGFGALPLYTVGVAYLDEIANPKVVHYYIGLFYVFAALGPAFGFLLGSVFLSQYVDVGVTNHPDSDDPNFVGRWWAGYIVSGFAMIVVSIPLLLYPRQLPGTAWIMEEKRKKQVGTGKSTGSGHPEFGRLAIDGAQGSGLAARVKRALHEVVVMLKLVFALLLTPVLLTNTIGSTTEAFAVSGLVPFITKYFESQFGVTSSMASALTGIGSVVGVAGGILFSSWLMKHRKVQGARLAKYTAGIAFIAIFFVFAFLVRCKSPSIMGATLPYPGGSVSGANRCDLNYTHSCVSSCGCVSERYDPVCGNDGFTYPTPCLAGCQAFRNATSGKKNDRTYLNCSCIAANQVESNYSVWNATATVGICKSSCGLLPLFMVLVIGLMFTTFMNNVPAIQVVLQSVPADRRTLATGVQWIILRLLGNVPGPVFYGFLLDKGCSLWQLNCCNEGNCWEYDNAHMSNAMFGATMVCKLLSFCTFFLSWRFYLHDSKKKAEGASTNGDAL